MSEVKYQVVEHDGGWAYRVGDVYSETFRTHAEALAAADAAAQRQQLAGQSEAIEYEDASGNWHQEIVGGGDRPETVVEDLHPGTQRSGNVR